MIIALKIDVTKLDKKRFFKGKGTAVYADLILNIKDDLSEDEYGSCGFASQSISKEERQAGTRLPILGNAKLLSGPSQRQAPAQSHAASTRQSPPPSNELPDDEVPF